MPPSQFLPKDAVWSVHFMTPDMHLSTHTQCISLWHLICIYPPTHNASVYVGVSMYTYTHTFVCIRSVWWNDNYYCNCVTSNMRCGTIKRDDTANSNPRQKIRGGASCLWEGPPTCGYTISLGVELCPLILVLYVMPFWHGCGAKLNKLLKQSTVLICSGPLY